MVEHPLRLRASPAMSINNLFWAAFVVFAAIVLYVDGGTDLLALGGPLGPGKVLVWAVFAAFLAYSAYCSAREDLFRSIGEIARLHWGRQIGIDLYLGFTLAACLIYLNDGSLAVALLWLAPIYVYGNLATLLYVAVHYDELVARFVA
jgi:hypothetical protein